MERLEILDAFDLGTHGDRREQEYWPLLSQMFPSYEILWRRLIVPLTNRVDLRTVTKPEEWIRFRTRVPEKYEKMAMAHYSVFCFLGRAAKRILDERPALEYPEDVLFLLDSVGDNFKAFLFAMNAIGADTDSRIFEASISQFPKGFDPFEEISDYRDVLLHNAVIGRGIDAERTYIPKWNRVKSASPLHRSKSSWRVAEQLTPGDLVSTVDLFERLFREVCATLEAHWKTAIAAVSRKPFEHKFVGTTGLMEHLPPMIAPFPADFVPSPSGSFSASLGSDATFEVGPCRSDAYSYDLLRIRKKG